MEVSPIATIRNDVNGAPSSATADDDQIIRFVYENGRRTKYWVDLYPASPSSPGTEDQVTVYTYGVTKGTNPGDSKISSGSLLKQVAYPDSTGGTDVVAFAYNAQGQEIWRKDQSGNVMESTYDDSGRRIHERATTVVTGFDDNVRRISTAYDAHGRVSSVSSHDHAAPGSGSVLNEVEMQYDDWGNLAIFRTDPDSAIGAEPAPKERRTVATGEASRAAAQRNPWTARKGVLSAPAGVEEALDDSIDLRKDVLATRRSALPPLLRSGFELGGALSTGSAAGRCAPFSPLHPWLRSCTPPGCKTATSRLDFVDRGISSPPPEFTFAHDPAGNMTDDGEHYAYEYDAWYRLVRIRNRSTTDLVAEYTYYGNGYRASSHTDTNLDGDVDGDDPVYHFAYDERWRIVATFRDDDSDPKERFLHHAAGLNGYGGSSYIDSVILRDRDAATDWEPVSDWAATAPTQDASATCRRPTTRMVSGSSGTGARGSRLGAQRASR